MANNLFSYPHVEDYIEIIAGMRKVDGKKCSIFEPYDSPISLARYDVNMVESLSSQSTNNIGYTDRQSGVAKTIVLKYERQLLKLGVSIDPIKDHALYRLPLRYLDRTSRVWVEGDKVYMRFPYNTALIDTVRSAVKEVNGAFKFDRENKCWAADVTEDTINWIHTFASRNNFEIDSSVQDLMSVLLAAENTPYEIKLHATSDALAISNADDSLVAYIDEHLGGFAEDNLLRLVDYSPVLGYSVDPVIQEVVAEAYGSRFWTLCSTRELLVPQSPLNAAQVTDIVKYAKATNRFPIYVYDPDVSNRVINLFKDHFADTEVANVDNAAVQVTDSTKIVYTRRVPKTQFARIPLLVSSAGMLFGGDRQMWVQTAEKVIYLTNEVYHTTKKGHTVCKLS